MAVFTSAAMSLRRELIISGLMKAGAFSPDTAKTLEEAGVETPGLFPEYTDQLVDFGIINKTGDGRYWMEKK